jgi:hypothetical protein
MLAVSVMNAVGVVILVNVAAEDGEVGLPVALAAAVSVPAKPP